jgi:hypothetical protein
MNESWASVVDLLTGSLCFPRVLIYTKHKQPLSAQDEKTIKRQLNLSVPELKQIWTDVQDTTGDFDEDEELLLQLKEEIK